MLNLETATKAEFTAALTDAGVTVPRKANLAILRSLYEAQTPPPAPEAPEAATPSGTGLKIEKDRPEQNGVKRPSIGGKCRAVWDALDAYRAETGELPTIKTVKELAADEGWNPNNASIEYYQWRKFNGIAKGK